MQHYQLTNSIPEEMGVE